MASATAELKRKPAVGSGDTKGPLAAEELRKMHAYWRASNYLAVGQIYLLDNPFLNEPLKREHVKPRLLGHWGTSPGLNMLYVHLNRVIKKDDLNMIYIVGPGHGGRANHISSKEPTPRAIMFKYALFVTRPDVLPDCPAIAFPGAKQCHFPFHASFLPATEIPTGPIPDSTRAEPICR
jgi:hypothetical protein